MVTTLWLGVMGSLAVSVIGVMVGYFYARHLLEVGAQLADDRTARLLIDLEKMVKGQPEEKKTPEEEEKAQKEHDEYWIKIADLFMKRFKEIDAKTAGGMLTGKQDEAKGLLDMLSFVKENKGDPGKIQAALFNRANW